MLSVRKGTTKRCCYGSCKSDTRYKSYKTNTYYFVNFPKPCLEYRKKIIKSSNKLHIKACAKCAKCELWVKKCGRSDRGFRSIGDVTKDTYICSLHFLGESGPTEENPNPLSYQEFQHIDKSINKVLKARTSLSEKYTRVEMKKADGSQYRKINDIVTDTQGQEEIMRCSVLSCRTYSESKLPGISFHSFPDELELRNLWIAFTKRLNWAPKPSSRICSLHFDSKLLRKKGKKTFILHDAVPHKLTGLEHVSVSDGDPMPSTFIESIKMEKKGTRSQEKKRKDCSTKMTEVNTEIKNNANVETINGPDILQDLLRECRACLQKFEVDSFLFNLFESWSSPWDGLQSTIAEDLAKLADVQISESDGYSKVICQVCYQRLQDACQFTATVQGSDRLIRQMYTLQQQKNDTTTDIIWPEPIKVNKNLVSNAYDSAMEVDIKQEVMSEEDYEENMLEEGNRETNLASLEIKVEPEEFTESQPSSIGLNEPYPINHYPEPALTNGNDLYDNDDDNDYSEPGLEVKQEPLSDEEVDAAPDLPLDCMLCLKSFNSVTGLKAHVIAQHSYKTVRRKTSQIISPEKMYKDRYVCATCQRIFMTSTDLMVHETCHNKDVCYGCNEKFDTFEQLTRHIKRCKAIINKAVQRPKTLEDVKRPQIEEPVDIENHEYIVPDRDSPYREDLIDKSMKIHLEIHSIQRAETETDPIDSISKEIKVEAIENVLSEDKVTP